VTPPSPALPIRNRSDPLDPAGPQIIAGRPSRNDIADAPPSARHFQRIILILFQRIILILFQRIILILFQRIILILQEQIDALKVEPLPATVSIGAVRYDQQKRISGVGARLPRPGTP
jgi:hypothetical protein